MDNEIERKIDVTAILVQNWQQTHDWTVIGSCANGLGIQEWWWANKAIKCAVVNQTCHSISKEPFIITYTVL